LLFRGIQGGAVAHCAPSRAYRSLAQENIRVWSFSLRQLPFANSRRRAYSGEIPPCFKGIWPDRPNLRDWPGAEMRSLNRFRLFPSEPRRIWFGQRKRNVSSRLPIRVARTFHRSSAARHSIRDTRSGRCVARGCAGLRMRQPKWPDRKGLQNRLLSTPDEKRRGDRFANRTVTC